MKEVFNYEKNPDEIEFICPKCGTKEKIPTEIVEMFDSMDSIGVDISYPPRFDCEKCDKKMVPIHYISVHRIEYTYKN